jgi:hypothetical protein
MRAPLGRRHKRWLYLCSVLLFATGAGWLVAHYAIRSSELIAEGLPHPSESWLMRLHGAATLGFLIVFGALLPEHVLYGWRHRLNRWSGVSVIVGVALLTLSGYGLYYASSDWVRQWISLLHWSIGLLATALLIWHIVHGRALRRERLRG